MAIHLFTLSLLLADGLVDASRGQVENLALDLDPYDTGDDKCKFDFDPVTDYYWDPTCRVEGPADLPDGCNADMKHVECRFCGKGLYEKIICPEEPEPEQVQPEPTEEGEEEQPEPTEEEQLEPTEVNTKSQGEEEQPETTEEQLEPTEVTTAQGEEEEEPEPSEEQFEPAEVTTGEEEEPEPTEEQFEPAEVTTGEEEQPEPTDISKTVQGEEEQPEPTDISKTVQGEEQPEPTEEQLEPAKASTTAKSKEQLEPTVSTTSKSEETPLPAVTTLPGAKRAEKCTTECGAAILAGTDVVKELPIFQCAQCVDVGAGTGFWGTYGKGKMPCEKALKGSKALYKSDLVKRCCVFHNCD